MNLDAKNALVLNRLQQGIPLVERPWLAIAADLKLGEEEVIHTLAELEGTGIIRRIGGIFNPRKLGYEVRLYAMQVEDELFYGVADVVNSFQTVTHNYRREGRLNMWFTLAARTEEERENMLGLIREAAGNTMLYEFPAEQVYKLNVFWNMDTKKRANQDE
ncbi:siroheme decarboxylase subunit alpha [Paenibacillus jiagnxiensis]|uniref:siroheme decarboxylase subunit alpha n=1 Tax=Paenibacillus jiagnxiensis TaxID=3228926 RepID=UPI0033A6452A